MRLRLSHDTVKEISGTPALVYFYKEAQFAVQCWTARASGILPPGADFGTLFSKPSILKTRPRTDKLRRMEEVILQRLQITEDIQASRSTKMTAERKSCISLAVSCRTLIRLTTPPCQLEGLFLGR